MLGYGSVLEFYVFRQLCCYSLFFRRHGNTVRMSAMLMDLPECTGAVLQTVSYEIIDRDTLEILEDAVNGKLLQIW